MKWVALVLILLVIVIVFGIWRRLQADRARHRPDSALPAQLSSPPPAPVTPQPPPTATSVTTPAAEASADEVPVGPAHEEHPAAGSTTGAAGEDRSRSEPSAAEDWWTDETSRDKPG